MNIFYLLFEYLLICAQKDQQINKLEFCFEYLVIFLEMCTFVGKISVKLNCASFLTENDPKWPENDQYVQIIKILLL
jgi:hypothetical protein